MPSIIYGTAGIPRHSVELRRWRCSSAAVQYMAAVDSGPGSHNTYMYHGWRPGLHSSLSRNPIGHFQARYAVLPTRATEGVVMQVRVEGTAQTCRSRLALSFLRNLGPKMPQRDDRFRHRSKEYLARGCEPYNLGIHPRRTVCRSLPTR